MTSWRGRRRAYGYVRHLFIVVSVLRGRSELHDDRWSIADSQPSSRNPHPPKQASHNNRLLQFRNDSGFLSNKSGQARGFALYMDNKAPKASVYKRGLLISVRSGVNARAVATAHQPSRSAYRREFRPGRRPIRHAHCTEANLAQHHWSSTGSDHGPDTASVQISRAASISPAAARPPNERPLLRPTKPAIKLRPLKRDNQEGMTPDALESESSGSRRLVCVVGRDLRLCRSRRSRRRRRWRRRDNSINVLMVNNPQMLALQKHIGEFTKESGITVNFTVKPENEMRNQAAQEFANQSGQFDVATLSNFEIPWYSKNNWLWSMDDIQAYKDDKDFNQADIFPAMTESLKGPDGKLYGEPFYGESSFLMYRKDVADKAGVTIKDKPTWDEVAAAAAKLDGAESGMKGICLRGLPGWGEVFAPLTTVVNTFGGTWFEKDWTAKVNAPEFNEATTFYTDLVKAHGEAGAAQAGFAECLTATTQSKVAMWYDATSAAGSLEAPDSPVKGKMAYAQAPVKMTDASGWLYTWAWAIEKKSAEARQRVEVHLLGVVEEV